MADSKPNIIFCHVDQLHHNAFSGTGNKWVSTPTYDEIAADGLSFERAISSNPICCPARTCWYTGRVSSENGVFSNGNGQLLPELPDTGKLMTDAGYDCYYGGKWHVPGRNASQSFKVIYPYIHVGERNDEALGAMGEAFLKHYTGDKPFFLNLGFMNPHDCCEMPKDAGQNTFKKGMGRLIGDANLPPLPPNYDPKIPLPKAAKDWTPEQVQVYLYTYYRMCETADQAVGRVYRAFKASSFFENTVFIWGSDHGEMMSEHNRFGKNMPYEASQRVPLRIVAKNRVAPGTTNDTHWIQGVDVPATIADYAGVTIPGANVCKSFRAIAEGNQTADWHNYAASESNTHYPMVTFRKGTTKSVFHLSKNEAEYYDISTDPWEMHDLAAGGANPAGLNEHRAYLADYQGRVRYLAAYQEAVTTGKFPKPPKGSHKGHKEADDEDS